MSQPNGVGKVAESKVNDNAEYVKHVLCDLQDALDRKVILLENAYRHVCNLKGLYGTIPSCEQDPRVLKAFSMIEQNWNNCIIDRKQPRGRQIVPRPGVRYYGLFHNVDLGRDWEGPFFNYGRAFVLRPLPSETKCKPHTMSGSLANSPTFSTTPLELPTPTFCVKCKRGPLYNNNGKDCWECMET